MGAQWWQDQIDAAAKEAQLIFKRTAVAINEMDPSYLDRVAKDKVPNDPMVIETLNRKFEVANFDKHLRTVQPMWFIVDIGMVVCKKCIPLVKDLMINTVSDKCNLCDTAPTDGYYKEIVVVSGPLTTMFHVGHCCEDML